MPRERRLISLCLAGLERMYIPSEHVFSASYQQAGETMVHRRDRKLEYRYTLNALLGLHRARASGNKIFCDPEADYRRIASRIEEQSNSGEDIAATVWTGRCLGTDIPPRAMELLDAVVESRADGACLAATDLAWVIVAYTDLGEAYREKALAVARLAADRYVHPKSALVMQAPASHRRDFAKYAASSYMAYAFLHLGRVTGDAWARDIGLGIARALVGLQGPQGQWGWRNYIPTGRVADYYPVYSVHQHSMAPFFLLEGIDQGFEEFRGPLLKGFNWILGHNEIGQNLAEGRQGLIWRSVQRDGRDSRLWRVARAAGAAYLGLSPRVETPRSLVVNHECRSYELGWALFVFSGRHDFDQILDDPGFC